MAKTKKTIPLNPNRLRDDFQYCVEYDSQTHRNKCTCEYICRCSTLTVCVKSVSIDSIVSHIFERTNQCDNEMLKYCFHRILTHSHARNPENWEVNIGRGYYGEEVRSIVLCHSTACEIIDKLSEIMKYKTNSQKILSVLEHEYGYVLDSIKSITQCTMESVLTSDIVVPQQDHYRKLDKEVVEKYVSYELPTCVCLREGNKYRLIDGYHRLQARLKRANKINTPNKTQIIVLE